MIALQPKQTDTASETTFPSPTQSHREFVGHVESFDLVSAMQFNLLTFLGLRESHSMLDIGCGSLRAGRLFIPYLLPGCYFGLDPYQQVIEDGIKYECGQGLVDLKNPRFSYDENFTLTVFGRKFDFILAQGVFCSCSQDQIRRCLSQARECMKKDSIFAASFIPGAEDYTGGAFAYPDWVTYTPERIGELVTEAGLKCTPIDWHHPNKLNWILITHPETEVEVPDAGSVQRLAVERDEYRERLSELKSHPYVKAGTKMASLISRFKLNRRLQRIRKSSCACSS